MWGEQTSLPSLSARLKAVLIAQRVLAASVLRTTTGVRIQYSDGRIGQLAKEDTVSEESFREAVEQWIRRHGVGQNPIDWE